ncbi:PfkB family carbohydrate kinase [Nonomuraea sp. NPDC046802]|uniref:PfkB family carbohydrate kinase n=1 Tax=Nonomuraea sp. NPDC046802 TaxID=3154919 RepID=UPI0034103056
MGELVTLGEVMAVTRVSGIGTPSPGAAATLSYAGAEATVAIGVARLGHRATWLGRLGQDAAADMILTSMRGEGVDVSHTVRDGERPTGYRALLWPSEQAGEVLRRLVGRAQVVFAGLEEARLVTNGVPAAQADEDDPGVLARLLLDLGPREVVIKLGREGAYVTDGNTALRVPAREVSEIDPVGAGDAFVAGYLSGRLDGLDLAGRAGRAVTCGAFAVSTWGDWEGLPRRRELNLLAAGDGVAR